MMNSPYQAPAGRGDPAVELVAGERQHLINLSYRLLGSLAEAEDAVQETYIRWYAMSPDQRAGIEAPGAWLTKVASRICLDMLGSARARRERYVGDWVPEPLPDRRGWMSGRPGDTALDPADRVSLDESISMAFLVVLESMTPPERVAFILHDVFGYPFAEIARIVGRNPGACRQLASSARRRLGNATEQSPAGDQARLVTEFRRAWEVHDIAALIDLLDPNATLTTDGGGRVQSALRPIEGPDKIARFLIGIQDRTGRRLTFTERDVNGQPGLLTYLDGDIDTVFAFDLRDGRITHLWGVRNPDKLHAWRGVHRRATRSSRNGQGSVPNQP
ncbi:MAG TPA: RNA polymerase sigma factor SigJ [Beutenbergiaceae bacterium]|nr:RNA polymerase sigma factor SigJ [Beutenbergiaceae bacterium]